jgi:hypothetical protein
MKSIGFFCASIFLCFPSLIFASPSSFEDHGFVKLPPQIRPYFPRDLEFTNSDVFSASFRKPTTKGYRPVSLLDLQPSQKLNAAQETCWNIVLSGGRDCDPIAMPSVDQLRNTDLLYAARSVSHDHGMRASRDWLEKAITAQDDSHGAMESRIIETTKDPQFVFSDSLLALSPDQKARIGIYIIPGFRFVGGLGRPSLDFIAQKAIKLGFQSKVLPVTGGGSAIVNADIIRDQVAELAPKVDHIILVSLSKGTNDVSYFLIHQMHSLPDETQQKINAIVSLSGAVRAIYMAEWVMNTRGATTAYFKKYVLNFMPKGQRTLDGLHSMTQDPWKDADYSTLPGKDRITWINFSMFPPSPTGFLSKESFFRLFTFFALAGDHNVGPYDGLIETGASVLPPNTGYKQWIVRACGDHELVDNHFLDGTPVTANYDYKNPENNGKAGGAVLDAVLRAFPVSILQ